MSVEIAGAEHHAEYEGRRFYFCSAGCKSSFQADPTRYATAEAASAKQNA